MSRVARNALNQPAPAAIHWTLPPTPLLCITTWFHTTKTKRTPDHQTTILGKMESFSPPIRTRTIFRGRAAGTCNTTLQSSTLKEDRELNLGLAARNLPESHGSATTLLRLIDLYLHTSTHVVYCDSRDIP
ncbi:hypothetical protein GW7_02035 [Heterocephalus glaber]|uniref:Uncharacterized protein n=1 Tax=Heterocephalus glaber TaxID=10181 RepID=G5B2N9_HETGA|nr:hypothetical protein GW7_02035 [Heterocephalus glaber]